MRSFAALAAVLALCTAPAGAQPAQRCSHDTFAVAGTPVAVTVCAGAPENGKAVAVTETFKGPASSFNHATSIDVLPGVAASRTVDDVSLAPLGLAYSLHLTLVYKEAAISIEHALLLPGAVPLK